RCNLPCRCNVRRCVQFRTNSPPPAAGRPVRLTILICLSVTCQRPPARCTAVRNGPLHRRRMGPRQHLICPAACSNRSDDSLAEGKTVHTTSRNILNECTLFTGCAICCVINAKVVVRDVRFKKLPSGFDSGSLGVVGFFYNRAVVMEKAAQ